MEEKDCFNGSGFTIKACQVPKSFSLEPTIQPRDQRGGGSVAQPPLAASTAEKKKRGRPRKYLADGSMVALSPVPISASIPLAGEYSSLKGSFNKKKNKSDFGSSGVVYPVGGGLTPHILTVNPGEDVMKKVISFSQQGSRAICILAANGFISNVTLRQPNSSGGTLTYEGCFEILSLTGSFVLKDDGVTKSRSGGISVLLAGPDSRVLGGGLAGVLIASGPVHLVIGSFTPIEQAHRKPMKHNYAHTISFAAPETTDLVSEERFNSVYNVMNLNFTSSPLLTSENSYKTTLPGSISSFEGQTSREQNHEIEC